MRSSRPNLEMSWPAGLEQPPLEPRDLHVWSATLDTPVEPSEDFSGILDETEVSRASRFHFERDRIRFINAHTFLRHILARYLHTAPGSFRFTYGIHGKPRLDGRHAKSGLHFNLAHSQDLALVAVTRLGPVGVDLELIRYLEELDELVSRFFSPREAVAFYRLPADDKPDAFFKLWTRKEAWLKATGEGIAHSLSQVEVSFLPGEPARLLRVPHGHAPIQSWSLDNLAPAAAYVGAVAVLAPRSWVRCWHWQPEMGEVV